MHSPDVPDHDKEAKVAAAATRAKIPPPRPLLYKGDPPPPAVHLGVLHQRGIPRLQETMPGKQTTKKRQAATQAPRKGPPCGIWSSRSKRHYRVYNANNNIAIRPVP